MDTKLFIAGIMHCYKKQTCYECCCRHSPECVNDMMAYGDKDPATHYAELLMIAYNQGINDTYEGIQRNNYIKRAK